MNAEERLPEFLNKISADLDRTVDFWLKNSHDTDHGGFYTCLSRDGKIYDDTKYCWLQGRQVWTYAKLYNDVERFQRPEILDVAKHGGEFLLNHVKNSENWKCYFSATKDGKPVNIQRTIFSECFYAMAMSELARATSSDKYRHEAIGMMEKILYWVRVDDSVLGRPKLTGATPTSQLAVPMMILCLVDQLISMDTTLIDKYSEVIRWGIKQVLMHVQRNSTMVLEEVSLDGKELPGCAGRKMVPGHAIEAGWFLLSLAKKTKDTQLKKTAIDIFINAPFSNGWDKKFGGLFYILDVDGLSPTHLEWNMKLWWPHSEALIAFLMAYQETKDPIQLEKFAQVFDYSYTHFVDETDGEWYGYLNRQGEVNMDFKGGPFKGCFHVPRCLLMCEQLLKELMTK